MSNKKLVSDTIFFAFTNYFGQFLAIIRGFVVAKFLAPNVFGILGGLGLIQFYTAQGHLGILHGMNRELSLRKGAKDISGYEDVKSTSFNSIIVLALLISVGIVLYAQAAQASYSDYVVWGIRIFGIAVIFQHLEMIYHSVLRAEYKMKIVSLSRMLFVTANLLLVVIIVPFWGFYGVLASYFGARSITILYLVFVSKIKFSLHFDRNVVNSLIKTGLPITFMFLVEVILTTVDRLMIIRYLNITQLGYYTIAVTLCEALSRLPNAIIYTYFPKMLEKYGETNDIASLRYHFEVPSLILGICVAFLIGLAFLFIGILILNFLPAYKEAISASKILLFSVFFMSLTQMCARLLITIKRNRLIILFQIVVIILSVILNLIFLKLGYGIVGIAIGTTIAYTLYAVSAVSYTMSLFYKRKLEILKKQFIIYSPLLFCSALLLIINNLVKHPLEVSRGLFPDLANIIMPLLFFVVSFILISYRLIYSYRGIIPMYSLRIFSKK